MKKAEKIVGQIGSVKIVEGPDGLWYLKLDKQSLFELKRAVEAHNVEKVEEIIGVNRGTHYYWVGGVPARITVDENGFEIEINGEVTGLPNPWD